MQKIKYLLRAAIVISVVLALVLPGTAVVTNMNTKNNSKIQYKYNMVTETAIKRTQSTPESLTRGIDMLVSWDSTSDEDDNTPKITQNVDGVIAVTYATKTGATTKVIPVSYSEDNGDTWTTQFRLDSAEWEEGSGFLESPDITFSPEADNFFLSFMDPFGTYATGYTWIPSDIGSVEEILIGRYSWTDNTDFTECATTHTGIWQLILDISTGNDIVDCPGLSYNTYDEEGDTYINPGEYNSEWAAGTYYDGQSILNTAPASKPEMATGTARLYMVMETDNQTAGYKEISYKSTYNDLDPESETFLFTDGGGPQGMDKYADIEVWPFQMYIATQATDPDVAAAGETVAVVYTQDGNVKCKASDDNGANWAESTVAEGGYPCVYVGSSPSKIFVGYVDDGNLYLKDSGNLGTSWSDPTQINDEEGTVIEEPGTASLGASGIVWTDERDESKDVYFEYIELEVNQPPSAPTITGPVNGNAGEPIDYKFNSVDPDDNQVKYIVEWGDGKTETTPLNPSGTDVTLTHTYNDEGDYTIKAHAQDENGLDGPESTKDISMPRAKALTWNSLLLKILEHFPLLQKILNI